MTKDDQQAMDTHGITCKSKNFYHHKEFGYDRLEVALRYAEIDTKRSRLKDSNS